MEEVKEVELNGLLFDGQISEATLNSLRDEFKFYPIIKSETVQMAATVFESVSFENALSLLKKMQTSWVLQNNLTLLEEFFSVLEHLEKLWPNQRTEFFEHLWFILKSNLGATNLQIIFNDIELSTGERGKNRLTQNKVMGKKFPEAVSGTEVDERLMSNYKNNFISHFNICEFNEQKGEAVITAVINKGPILVMTNLLTISRLQKAVLGMLFEGINRAVTKH